MTSRINTWLILSAAKPKRGIAVNATDSKINAKDFMITSWCGATPGHSRIEKVTSTAIRYGINGMNLGFGTYLLARRMLMRHHNELLGPCGVYCSPAYRITADRADAGKPAFGNR
jgi:hypothetical protein